MIPMVRRSVVKSLIWLMTPLKSFKWHDSQEPVVGIHVDTKVSLKEYCRFLMLMYM